MTDFTPEELLAMTERALERLDWGQVHALASDVLALQPDNTEAAMLRALADRHGGRSWLPGRRQATALVVDLVESTPLAERYDVEVYGSVLRAFELACRPVVESHEGHFVDVQGDAIVACFGYPSGHEDDASRAVSAGLDILAALRPIAARLQAELGVELHARIGIDTGIVVIDGAGVLGPALNRAARLQALAAPDTVLISATTNELVAERFDTQPLGPTALKGVDAPIEVHRVIGRRDPVRPARALRSTSLPFVGRDAELQRVLDLWEGAPPVQRDGAGVGEPGQALLVLITGEPGIGKSRLASAVVQRAVEAGAGVFEVYCSSYSVTSTLYPVRTAIASRLSSLVERYPAAWPSRTLARYRIGLSPTAAWNLVASSVRDMPTSRARACRVQGRAGWPRTSAAACSIRESRSVRGGSRPACPAPTR